MTAEEILITHQVYTDTAYASCGDSGCTMTILRSVGVPEGDAADPESVRNLEIGDDTQVTCALLGESDSCEHCAACRDFIRHGTRYPGEDIGCRHDPDAEDPENLGRPHPDLKDAPAMREFWS